VEDQGVVSCVFLDPGVEHEDSYFEDVFVMCVVINGKHVIKGYQFVEDNA